MESQTRASYEIVAPAGRVAGVAKPLFGPLVCDIFREAPHENTILEGLDVEKYHIFNYLQGKCGDPFGGHFGPPFGPPFGPLFGPHFVAIFPFFHNLDFRWKNARRVHESTVSGLMLGAVFWSIWGINLGPFWESFWPSFGESFGDHFWDSFWR